MTTSRKGLGFWVVAGVISACLFLLLVVGASVTKGYNDDFCFSTRAAPPSGWTSVEIDFSYTSRTVECTYQLRDGRLETVTYEVGTYTSLVLMFLAYSVPVIFVAALLFAVLKPPGPSTHPQPRRPQS